MLPDCACISFITASRFEFWIFGFWKFINTERKVLTGPARNCYHSSELCNVWDKDFVVALFNFAQTLHNLQMTDMEIALVRCICLTYTGRVKEINKYFHITWECLLQFVFVNLSFFWKKMYIYCRSMWIKKPRKSRRNPVENAYVSAVCGRKKSQ